MVDALTVVAEHRRADAIAALGSVADPASVTSIRPTTGGASGSTFRVDVASRTYVLRIEERRRGLQNPRRSYPCLRAAAAAGLAPVVHYSDEAAGVILMDFIDERPLATFPGGTPSLVRALGAMVADLQTVAPFPTLTENFGVLVQVMFDLVRDGGLFATGVLDQHADALTRLRAEYPWDVAQVAAHNDVNPRNVLFDGDRLWLVDWELAFGNDAMGDLANVANHFAELHNVDDLVLQGWMRRPPDDDTRHRLTLMRDLHRLFYGALLLSDFIGRRAPEGQLTAPTPEEFRAAITRGELRGTAELPFVLGKMNLVAVCAAQGS